MKKHLLGLLLAAVAVAVSAQTYPTFNPTYTPSAIQATVALPTGVSSVPFTVSGIGTVTVRVTGTCSSLGATVTATNDGTNYTTVNMYPIATGTSAPTAVASISAAGFWKVNTMGFTGIKFVVSALTVANCSVTMVGGSEGFNGTTF